jgi:DNA topoisomerase-1
MKPVQRLPSPPFTTSSLQQEASRKLGFGATRTMKVAQELYEGAGTGKNMLHIHVSRFQPFDTLHLHVGEGLITYMRTDGLQLEGGAVTSIRSVAKSCFGDSFVPAAPRYLSCGMFRLI